MQEFLGCMKKSIVKRKKMVVYMTNRIPEEVIERVRQSNDIVEVVGEFVQLKKRGKNYFGLCPFHDENTPSFSVAEDKQIYHCFGCKKGGNVLSFIMEIEGLSFYESLVLLAERGDIELPTIQEKSPTPENEENAQLLSAYDWLTKLYHHVLRYSKDGEEGLTYLKKRGISEESIDTFQLGYAPNKANFTATFLEKKGFHRQLLLKSGLLSEREGNDVADPFRGRVVFPIRNHIGKVIAFGGRTISGAQPKYLNSSESPLFRKSQILYNFDEARKHMRKTNEVILCEGQMDAIAITEAGCPHVVATLGTALTEHQAQLLKRYVDTVVICYDGDQAGLEASFRAAMLLQNSGCSIKISNLATDMDPDGFIHQYGPELFKSQMIDNSQSFVSFYMRYIKKEYNLQSESDRVQYVRRIIEHIATLDSSIEREYYLQEISKEYDLSMESLQAELEEHVSRIEPRQDKTSQKRYTTNVTSWKRNERLLPAYQNAERTLLALMLHDPTIARRVQREIETQFNVEEHKVIVTYLYAFYEVEDRSDVSLFIERLPDEHLKQLVIEIAMIPLFDHIEPAEIDDYMHVIRVESNDMKQLSDYKEQQKVAEQQNDPIKAAEIAQKMLEIQKKLKKFN